MFNLLIKNIFSDWYFWNWSRKCWRFAEDRNRPWSQRKRYVYNL